MKKYRVVLKTSILSLLLIANTMLLGMEHSYGSASVTPTAVSTVCLRQQILVPVELMIDIAAQGDHEIKNIFQQTCWFFKKGLSRYNPEFLALPVFRASRKDIDHIACYAAWFNDDVLEKALHKNYSVSNFSFMVTTRSRYIMTSLQMDIGVNDLKKLRNRLNNNHSAAYITDTLLYEVIPALYSAVECNDYEAVYGIGLQIKQISYEELCRINLHKSLLMQLVERDRKEMFECIIKLDPFNALNSYCPSVNLPAVYHPPFLDFLCESRNISQDKKDTYAALYKQYGGKNLIELKKDKRKEKPKKQKKQKCIIS